MHSWHQIFPKNPWLNLYAWIIFCILPVFFIFRSSVFLSIIGILLVLLFFLFHWLSFVTKRWVMYIWFSLEIAISFLMTILFGYMYFSLFFAFFIGNIQQKAGFFTIYGTHIVATLTGIGLWLFLEHAFFFSQLPFILICIIGVILLPFNTYYRNENEKLEGQLEDANKRISQLMIFEERQRIARDLHDTLGQKLSLIGLKSDLAGKLLPNDPVSAKNEVNDIHQTARTALREVRELVTDMRRIKLADEFIRIRQLLNAKNIALTIRGKEHVDNIPLLVENVLSMCLKEAITNVAKHSQASACTVSVEESANELVMKVKDDGIGIRPHVDFLKGYGLTGMKERLEFINGSLDIHSTNGTELIMRIPHVITHAAQEGLT